MFGLFNNNKKKKIYSLIYRYLGPETDRVYVYHALKKMPMEFGFFITLLSTLVKGQGVLEQNKLGLMVCDVLEMSFGRNEALDLLEMLDIFISTNNQEFLLGAKRVNIMTRAIHTRQIPELDDEYKRAVREYKKHEEYHHELSASTGVNLQDTSQNLSPFDRSIIIMENVWFLLPIVDEVVKLKNI